jgi:peroxiredoxin
MRLKYLLLLAFVFPSFVYAQDFYKQGYFVVKGQVSNFKEEFIDFGLTTYLDKASGSLRIKPDGSFEQKIPVQNRQSFYLALNNELFIFTVLDKDTVYLNWDHANFKNSFSIKGKSHLRTKELQVELKLHLKFFAGIMNLQRDLNENARKLTAGQQFEMVNALYNQQVNAVFAFADFFSNTLNHLITGLYFQYSRILWRQHLLPQYKLKLSLDSTRTYPYFVDVSDLSNDYTLLNEDWFWNVSEYRDFVYNYVRFYKPFNQYRGSSTAVQKPFNPTLDEYYLGQSYFLYTGIKDWFITKSIMDGFGHYSFRDVEKVYQQYINTCTIPYLKDTLQKYYTAIKRLKPGNPAPGFSLKNDKEEMVSVNDFKGKVVYIDFWGVGCGPCIYDIKNHVPDLHKKYKGKDVVFINICVDAKEKEWKEALSKYQLDGINLIAEGWSNNLVCKAYNVSGIPHYLLIDKNGKIANNNAPRAYELNAMLDINPIDVLLK